MTALRELWWQKPRFRPVVERTLEHCNSIRTLALTPAQRRDAYGRVFAELVPSFPEPRRPTPEQERIWGFVSVAETLLEAISMGEPPNPRLEQTLITWTDHLLGEASWNLASYGSLAPGEVNHHMVAECEGTWSEGYVRGDLEHTGWGAEHGFPVLTWRAEGKRVKVKLLRSNELPYEWDNLDEFEGNDYRRILVPVENPRRKIIAVANLYAARR